MTECSIRMYSKGQHVCIKHCVNKCKVQTVGRVNL